MSLKTPTLTFLGTGASSGVPVIGCSCAVCLSTEPKNRRLRSAALLSYSDKKYLIDAGPDIRQQALERHIDRVDGLILTHTHYDHLGGLEDLRIFNYKQQAPIPCVLSKQSLHEVKSQYHYHFKENSDGSNHTAKFDFIPLPHDHGTAAVGDLSFSYTTYKQGSMPVLGLRFGDLAYLTDIKTYDVSLYDFLKGVKTLVISALRFTPSTLHFTIDEAVDFVKEISPHRAYFIHLSHEIDYNHASTLLPKGMHIAYDGLVLHAEQ